MARRLAALLVAALCLLVAASPTWGKDRGMAGSFHFDCMWMATAADDPIVHPGASGRSHEHVFFGNPTISAHSTPASLRASEGRCQRAKDGSAYWIPGAYGHAVALPPATGRAFQLLRPNFAAVVYYRTAERKPGSIRPFPAGLKMIAGDASARGPQPGGVVGWSCGSLTGVVDVEVGKVRALRRRLARQRRVARRLQHTGSGPQLRRTRGKLWRIRDALRRAHAGETGARTECRGYLRLAIRFPDCWDGRRLDSPDHRSHMATARRTGATGSRICPRSHPVAVPQLVMKVRLERPDPSEIGRAHV